MLKKKKRKQPSTGYTLHVVLTLSYKTFNSVGMNVSNIQKDTLKPSFESTD